MSYWFIEDLFMTRNQDLLINLFSTKENPSRYFSTFFRKNRFETSLEESVSPNF